MKEEKELGLESSITEQEIEEAEQKLKDFQGKVSGETDEKEYRIFKPGKEMDVFKKVPGYEAVLRENEQ